MERFDYFNTLSPHLTQTILGFSHIRKLFKGETLYVQGNDVDAVYLLYKGSISYLRYSDESKYPMTLFRLEAAGIDFSYTPSQSEAIASAVAEQECELLLIDGAKLFALLQAQEDFVRFVFDQMMKRTHYLAKVAQEMRFSSLDKRVLDWIYQHGKKDIVMTHEEVALFHGTSREVVSRLLKRFEREGYVKLGRGHIERVA